MEVELEARGPCRASPHFCGPEPRRGRVPRGAETKGPGSGRDSAGREVGGDLLGSRDLG